MSTPVEELREGDKFTLLESTPDSSVPPTPDPSADHSGKWLDPRQSSEGPPSRSRSILNLTSSTLFGIYSPAGSNYADPNDLNTPWGTGAQTPARGSESQPFPADFQDPRAVVRASPRYPKTWAEAVTSAVFKGVVLFGFGLAYGLIITHLHDNERINPVKVDAIDRNHPLYLVFWGIVGVALGLGIPWIDSVLASAGFSEPVFAKRKFDGRNRQFPRISDWMSVIRPLTAFAGIGYGIRKLPWESTLQLSLTLALMNPVLWYILDRTISNFLVSTLVGFVGTSILFTVNQDLLPPPTASHGSTISPLAMSTEQVWVATWIASVLFCSSLCFGNIGRRLLAT